MRRPVETYEQAIEYLYGRINYERAQTGTFSPGDFKLDRTRRLLSLIDNPQQRLPAIHIAGTKGKGSTAVMVAEMLTAAGYRVGLFTSPHISAFEERMSVDGVSPDQEQLVELVNRIIEAVATMDQASSRWHPTYFEITTALAWLHFERQQAQLVVLEVGLGGRLDATNVCNPEAVVITNISRDHMTLLGSTLTEIAREKAGIIKPGVPVLSGVMDENVRTVVEEICSASCSELFQLGREVRYRSVVNGSQTPLPGSDHRALQTWIDVETPSQNWAAVPVPLVGEHQAANAALAVGVIDVLAAQGRHIAADAVYTGMANVRWPLRIEVLRQRPLVVVDAAHNWASVAALVKTLNASFPTRRGILVFATPRDKAVSGLLRQLMPQFDTIILTQYLNNPRALSVERLHRLVRSISTDPVHPAADPAAAWKLAGRLSTPDALVCITGSFFLAAEMRELILNEFQRSQFSAGLATHRAANRR